MSSGPVGLRSVHRFHGSAVIRILTLFCLSAGFLFSANWDRSGAQHALEEARRLRAALSLAAHPSEESYLLCIRTYKLVYAKDPHFNGSDDAVYEAATLYTEMGDKFGSVEYYKNAVKLFRFLVSDYGGSPYCPDALLRIGDLSRGPLEDEQASQEAYEQLRSQYKFSNAAAALKNNPAPKKNNPASRKDEPKAKESALNPGEVSSQRNTALVQSIRHWSTNDHTRVAIDLDAESRFSKTHLSNPERIYFDISNARASKDLQNKTLEVGDTCLKQVRVAQNRPDVVRVVLDFEAGHDYSIFELHNPYRIIVDILGPKSEQAHERAPLPGDSSLPVPITAASIVPDAKPVRGPHEPITPAKVSKLPLLPSPSVSKPPDQKSLEIKEIDNQPKAAEAVKPKPVDSPLPYASVPKTSEARSVSTTAPEVPPVSPPITASGGRLHQEKPATEGEETISPPKTGSDQTAKPANTPLPPAKTAATPQSESMPPASQKASSTLSTERPVVSHQQKSASGSEPLPNGDSKGPVIASSGEHKKPADLVPPVPLPAPRPTAPKPSSTTSRGDRTLTRMLGLKIGRIVIDPGHGGHDTGTIGRGGLLEKDLVLEVARNLRKMLEQNLGAEVVLTRDDDTFISLEERTAVANQSHADLFISIHANSSNSRSISGVETYFLDFAKTANAREVAARENATTVQNVRDLQDLIKKIAQADKSAESREFAASIQKNLYGGAQQIFPSTRNRGVRSAPFVVLIGANMPSVLAEVAFISNPRDEKMLKKEDCRERLAKALFAGIQGYMKTLASDVAQGHSNSN